VKHNQNSHHSAEYLEVKAGRWGAYYQSMPGLMYQRRILENRRRHALKARALRAERVDTQSNQLD
jgi:hypothetical protein